MHLSALFGRGEFLHFDFPKLFIPLSSLKYTPSLNARICSTDIVKLGLPTSPEYAEDEIPALEPVVMSSWSFSSLLSQYRLSSLSKIRLRAFKSRSRSHLRAPWSRGDSVMR